MPNDGNPDGTQECVEAPTWEEAIEASSMEAQGNSSRITKGKTTPAANQGIKTCCFSMDIHWRLNDCMGRISRSE